MKADHDQRFASVPGRTFWSRRKESVYHHARIQECSNQFQQPFVCDTTSHAAHQHIVLNSVEKLFQVHIDDPGVAFFQIFLGLGYRLVSRPGRKPKLFSEKVSSHCGESTKRIACWITRSTAVGMPSLRTPPSGLEISMRNTGWGR